MTTIALLPKILNIEMRSGMFVRMWSPDSASTVYLFTHCAGPQLCFVYEMGVICVTDCVIFTLLSSCVYYGSMRFNLLLLGIYEGNNPNKEFVWDM